MAVRVRDRVRWLVFGALATIGLLSSDAYAREVYVVRILSEIPAGCPEFGYRDVLLFHNTTSSDQQIVATAASNGYEIPPGQDLVVPSRRTRAVYIAPLGNTNAGGVENGWAPAFPRPVFLVNRLNVPEGVIVESRAEIFSFGGTELPCPTLSPGNLVPLEVSGHLPLPIISSLVPANTQHFHLASDIGTLTSRTNVGIYNSASEPASAVVELLAACNDQPLQTLTVQIPADSMVYFRAFTSTGDNGRCFGNSNAPGYSRYVVVTMDRAGFSFVATRAENLPPGATVGVATAR